MHRKLKLWAWGKAAILTSRTLLKLISSEDTIRIMRLNRVLKIEGMKEGRTTQEMTGAPAIITKVTRTSGSMIAGRVGIQETKGALRGLKHVIIATAKDTLQPNVQKTKTSTKAKRKRAEGMSDRNKKRNKINCEAPKHTKNEVILKENQCNIRNDLTRITMRRSIIKKSIE